MTELSPEMKALLRQARAEFSPEQNRLAAVRSALDAQIGASPSGLGAGRAAASSAGTTAGPVASATTWSAAHTLGAALLIGAVGAVGFATWRARTSSVGSSSVSSLVGSPLAHSQLTDNVPTPVPPVDEPRHDEKLAGEGAPPNADITASRSVPMRGIANDPRTSRARGRPRSKGDLARETPAESPVAQPASAATTPAQAAEMADSLTEEVHLLRDARAALDRADPSRALASLDEHAARFPRGTLYEERLATRVLALCAMGRVDAARLAAQELERAAPRSPHLGRVRASCIAVPAAP